MLNTHTHNKQKSDLQSYLFFIFYQGHTEDDNYFFDESCSVAEVDNSFDLMLLDLSNNK